MFNLTVVQWLIVSLSALFFGVSKTGLPGLGILAIPLMANVIPARASTGVVLPMLIFADIFAVAYYHKKAVWPHLVRIIPWAMAGIVVGYLIMGWINDQQLKPVIGLVILVMLALNYWRNSRGEDRPVPNRWWFAACMGLLAGITTMMANAAGPIMIIYLLAMRLPKTEFISTGAWYFFLLNWFKVPFSANLGLITPDSIRFNLVLFPVIAVGAIAGIIILKRIPEKAFNNIAQALAGLAAVKLLF